VKFKNIPIKISPFFWVTSALIGWMSSVRLPQPLLFTTVWVAVIFISILFHEFGHALTAQCFGQKARIELVATGGATYPEGGTLKGWREFLVVLDGPVAGLALFFLASLILGAEFFTSPHIIYTLRVVRWVNFFWTMMNLLPVLPLDGGQLLRIIFEAICGVRGVKYALLISVALSFVFSLVTSFVGLFTFGAIFALFAFQNLATWKRARMITSNDDDDALTQELKRVEELTLQKEHRGEAMLRLEELRRRAKKGLIFNLATQHLAALRIESEEFESVYVLLIPIKKHLAPRSQNYLHHAAHERGDYPLVVELAGPCFQAFPDYNVAIRSAEACAALARSKAAVGWLRAARKAGCGDLDSVTSKEIFNAIRHRREFIRFINQISVQAP